MMTPRQLWQISRIPALLKKVILGAIMMIYLRLGKTLNSLIVLLLDSSKTTQHVTNI